MPGRSVLVVEDDPDIREVLVTILESYDYHVVAAVDGAEALAKLRGGECPNPCVILLDFMMPGMNGAQFRDEQMNDPALAAIPVVVLSGDGRAPERASTLGLECLKKPVDFDMLLETVRRFCPA